MGLFVAASEKYAVFGGRSRRREYWFFVLFSSIITVVLSVIGGAIGLLDSSTGLGLLSGIFSQAILAPNIAWKQPVRPQPEDRRNIAPQTGQQATKS